MAAVKWWRTLQKVLDVFSGRTIIMKRKLKKLYGNFRKSLWQVPSIDFILVKLQLY